MAVYVIGDLHLSFAADKPMDVFSGWRDYVQKLETNWINSVSADDIVILAGDTSWAMNISELAADFSFINNLPGKKIILKGNHDYWWSTITKMNSFLADKGFDTISFLHNNAFIADDGTAICGTRGWLIEAGEENDVKVSKREAGRLKASLDAARFIGGIKEKIVVLHYPPLSADVENKDILAVLDEYGIEKCYYGHLHGRSAISRAVQGRRGGIFYKLISADALEFKPYKIL